MGKIRIGITQKSIGLPLRACLTQVQKLQIKGLEIDALADLSPRNLSQTGRRELRHLLRSHDAEFTALACPLRFGLDVAEKQEARIDYIREVLDLSVDLGPMRVIVHAGQMPAEETDPRWLRMRDALGALSQHGDRVGAVLVLESGLDDPKLLDTCLGRFDTGSLAVNYSPGNLLTGGFDPYEAARVLAKRIVHVHARDARVISPSRGAQEVPLGHGDIDWMQLLATLEEIDYKGWLTIDQIGGVPEASAAVKFLKRFVGGGE